MAYTIEQLTELVTDASVSPRLTPWEREFMESIARGLFTYKEALALSDKQVQVLQRIETKLYAT